jgi:hypothetical protein
VQVASVTSVQYRSTAGGAGASDPLAPSVASKANAVRLLAERLAHDPEQTVVLRVGGVPGEDDVVGAHRVDLVGFELVDALGVRVELDRFGVRVGVADALDRRRPGGGAHLLAGEVVGTLDRVIVLLDQQVLARDVVRPGEVDLGLALVIDRVRRDHEVDAIAADERLAVGRHRLDPLDVVLADPQLARDDLADLDVEALGSLGIEVDVAETRLVELRADPDLARVGQLGHRRAGRELRRLLDRDGGSAGITIVVTATTAEHESK